MAKTKPCPVEATDQKNKIFETMSISARQTD